MSSCCYFFKPFKWWCSSDGNVLFSNCAACVYSFRAFGMFRLRPLIQPFQICFKCDPTLSELNK